MFRKFLVVTTLMGVMIALSQFSIAQAAGGTATTPAVSGNTVLLGNGPTTPVMTYAAPGPTAGISNAGRAGISNTAPLPSTLPSNDTVVYYSQPGVQPMIVLPGAVAGTTGEAIAPEGTTGTAPAEGETPEGLGAAGESVGKVFDDYGPSSFGGTSLSANTTPNANTTSLAQIAAQYKAAKANLNARTLTNQDVQQMVDSKQGVTMAKNMPPLGPGPMPSSSAQSPTPQQSQPENAATSAEVPTGAGGQQPATPPPVDATQPQPAGSTATAGATTPQINPNQQSNDAQGKSKLPSTATFLPLLGLLGLISGGIGLLARKFRR